MARMTNRPSLIYSDASRYPSATPDPQFDQENMDPQHTSTRIAKGKQCATAPQSQTPPISLDGTNDTPRPQKRARLTANTHQENAPQASNKFVRYFDPEQDPELRREINRKQRDLSRNLHENREELLQDDGSALEQTVKQADKIFENVKQTGDACIDSRFLVSVGDLAVKKSAALNSGVKDAGVDVDDFISKCIIFMRGDRQPPASQRRTQTGADSDDEADVGPLDWERLGRYACYPYNARPPVPSFLLGPLSLVKKQRAPTQKRARQARNTQQEARPEALTKDDLTQSEQNSLTAQCTMLRRHLKQHLRAAGNEATEEGYGTPESASTPEAKAFFKTVKLRIVEGQIGVPLFEYAINPDSFGQTVENLFYISFLIKEGSAGIQLDDEGLPVLFTAKQTSIEQKREQNTTRQQAVLSLDYQTWQALIKAYNIKQSMIEHRQDIQATQPGARGWYT